MAPDGGELPIFELPVVLLPGELLPLHIFEERYKRMIADCLEGNEPFGIVFRDSDGSARRVGCEARVTEVTERFEDGRMNIIVTGERPFRILDRFDAPAYPTGEVEAAEDEAAEEVVAEAAGVEDAAETAGERARATFAELVRRVGGEPPPAEELEVASAYAIASRVELPPETKQELLELRSEPQRMEVLAAALEALLRALKRSREIAERAKLNGKLVVG